MNNARPIPVCMYVFIYSHMHTSLTYAQLDPRPIPICMYVFTYTYAYILIHIYIYDQSSL
jgi:hypothetical protein